MSPKVVRTIVKVTQGDEKAGQAARVQMSVWSEGKGFGKGKTDVISKESDLPLGAGFVTLDDHGPNGAGTKLSWSCPDGTLKEVIASKEETLEGPRGFISEAST